MSIVDEIKHQIKELEQKLLIIQQECNHPLAARKTTNRGVSGHWDDPEGTYWTDHICTLCERKWHTSQRWKHEGDGKGLPK